MIPPKMIPARIAVRGRDGVGETYDEGEIEKTEDDISGATELVSLGALVWCLNVVVKVRVAAGSNDSVNQKLSEPVLYKPNIA